MDDSSDDSTQNPLYGEEDHRRQTSVVTVDEIAELLFQVPVEQEVETANEGNDHKETDHRNGNKDLVEELRGKGHEGLTEKQVSKEGDVALDQALEQHAGREGVASKIDAHLFLEKQEEKSLEQEGDD